MSRRPANFSRRFGDGGGGLFSSSKSRSSPILSIGLIILGGLLLTAYSFKGSGGFGNYVESVSRVEGDYLCTAEVQRAIPVLKQAYGDSMHKVLHVGPDTCYVVSKLLKEEETEAWGIEPYDIEDANSNCKALVNKGIVRVADIKVSADGIVIFTGNPGNQKAKVANVSNFGRAAKLRSTSWWGRYFVQTN
ncbi:S-adenosyl-L-methionine-dependent methyltransferase [Quillaja saponaria]|uniref:S-adenosyl-L-methionine-dependent methyltransferase n=1 Tax=Quillaja saponaria TaxID=32244 RepID=A0AAD7LHI1_QUISA|nr:S-adenosyl-L-methionine-dependent methyltransferase [Quillaja saponaria]